MTALSPDTTVGDIVRAVPARSRAFDKLGIDYCCGGKRPLSEACRERGLDPATVVAMLSAFEEAPRTGEVNPQAMTLSQLCDHIQQVHHAYLREELPRLDAMTKKVAAVHGERDPRLIEVRRVFEAFEAKITAHTRQEDEEVFPAVRKLESGPGGDPLARAGLRAALEKLEQEHDEAGAALAQFNALTDHYTPPDWACNTLRALYDALARLEQDMHQHVHKENNVLFPSVVSPK